MGVDVDAIVDSVDPDKRIKELEKQVADLERQLHRLRKPRIRINPAAIPRSGNGQFVRVIVPDTHGCLVDPAALGAFFADLEILKPQEVILLGDHLDCGGFLAQHHTLGYVAQSAYTYEDDINATNQFLDDLQRLAPGATIDYLIGNHEERVEKWCVTQSLRNKEDAARLMRHNAPEHVLSLKARGIAFHRSDVRHDGLSVPGTIKRGMCHFTHGHRHGKHAAYAHVSQFGGNVVHGHTHRIQSHTLRTVSGGIAAGWSVGCLCELQPLYRHRDQTDWAHGYGVQFVQPTGEFAHLTVHIMDGKSYLIPLAREVGAA